VKNTIEATDDAICTIEENVDSGNEGCQVRRRIEDLLERRRYKDELGEFDDRHF